MKSQLQLGNRALRDGEPVAAIQCYLRALDEAPALARFTGFNILMAQRRLAQLRAQQPARRVAVCGWDLARSASRAHTLCLLHERSAQVELIGCLQPGAGADIWAPLQGSRFPRHLIAGEGEGFVERALRLVAEHPFDLVHLAQPRGPNVVIGLLYQLIWGARVLVDIDEDDVVRPDVDAPVAPGRWPAVHALADKDWTRIALDLVGSLDGTTVSNPALRARFGGTLLHHARDEARYAPSDALRAAGRQRMQLGAAPKVVLVCATQRNPAVLMEVGRAVAALDRQDVVLVVAGTAADAQAAAELRSRHGIDCRLVGDVPFDAMPELMAAADVHVVLQDPKGGPGNSRLPASLAEALLMGLPVVVRLAPELLVEPLKQAVIDTRTRPLLEALHQGLHDRTPAQRRQDAQATGLTQLLGLAHNAAILQGVLHARDASPPSAVPPMPAACLALLQALHPPRGVQALMALRGGSGAVQATLDEAPPRMPAAAASASAAPADGPATRAVSLAAPLAAPSPAPRAPDWTPCEGLLPTPDAGVVELLGQSLCLLPASATAERGEPLLTLLRAFADLHGRADAGSLRIRHLGETQPPRLGQRPAGAAWPARCSRWRLQAAGLQVADLWHADEHTLRLRLEALNPGQLQAEPCVLRAFQVQPGHDAMCIGAEALVADGGPAFVDVALVNPYWPVLLVVTDVQGLWRDGTLLPFPSLCRGGAHHGEVSAVGDRPVGMDNLEDLCNSLAAELAGWGRSPAPLSVGAVHVDLSGATGAERIFSPLVHEWLGEVLQLGALKPLPADGADADGVRDYLAQACELRLSEGASAEARHRVQVRTAGGALALALAADSLPTISALVSRRLALPAQAGAHTGAWIVADAATAKPRQLVALPPLSESLLGLQPFGRLQGFPLLRRRLGAAGERAEPVPGSHGSQAPFPLAIRFREGDREAQAALLQPLAPDSSHRLLRRVLTDSQRASATVSVLLHLPVGAAPEGPLLESLARQTLSAGVQLVVVLAAARAAERDGLVARLDQLFHGRHEVLLLNDGSASAAFNAAAERATGRHLLLAAPGALLHNPRTLEALQTLLHEPGVASAACVLLREVAVKRGQETRFYAGGLFPRQLTFDTVPSLVLDEPFTLDAFPMATYPVVGNSFRLALVDAEIWRALGGLDAERFAGHRADLDFCLRALRAGHAHLCTAAVTASLLEPGQPEEHSDSHALALMGLDRWHEVLSRVSLIRSLAP